MKVHRCVTRNLFTFHLLVALVVLPAPISGSGSEDGKHDDVHGSIRRRRLRKDDDGASRSPLTSDDVQFAILDTPTTTAYHPQSSSDTDTEPLALEDAEMSISTKSPSDTPSSSSPTTAKPTSKSPTLRPSQSPSQSPMTHAPTTSPTYSTKPSTSPSYPLQTFTTPFQSDTTFAGNMFDITPKTNNIAIFSMGINTYVHQLDVEIYTRDGSYKGYENDLSAWTFVGNTTVMGQGMDTPTMIDGALTEPLLIRMNSRRSFYITTNGPYLRATKGTVEGQEIYSNSDIAFFQGVGKRYPMDAGTHPARIWNGMIQYKIVDLPTLSPTLAPVKGEDSASRTTETDLGEVTFRRGDLATNVPNLGIKISTGMSVKLLARANQPVSLSDGSSSSMKFHSMPDGAAILPVDNGYVYVSNSEMKKSDATGEGLGGVYGMYFDNDGNVKEYKQLLSGTRRNCGGGRTPWDTWISCEEYGRGQCWQIDPNNQIPPQITKLGGSSGGNYESVAVDNTNIYQPIFYVTEDHEYGALRKYTPPILYSNDNEPIVANWDTLHANGGTTEYLRFRDNTFEWTTNELSARNSQARYFRNVEGIDYHNGYLAFVSKKLLVLYVLDLEGGTYRTTSTKNGVALSGEGSFRQSPDQLARNGDGGEYLYLTEDGGNTVGVYAIHQPTGRRYAMFEAYADMYHDDETTGLAFSTDGTKMYAAFQDCGCEESDGGLDYNCGCLLEFSREDGRSFDGSTLSLKFHSS